MNPIKGILLNKDGTLLDFNATWLVGLTGGRSVLRRCLISCAVPIVAMASSRQLNRYFTRLFRHIALLFTLEGTHNTDMTDILKYNRTAWDKQSEDEQSPWVQPVDSATIANARTGNWEVILTPSKNVPKNWFGDIRGKRVLCLASAGGQQAPILAAAGAIVTSFDNSSAQLAKDKLVADRDGLTIEVRQGDMADFSCFDGATFDLIFHPVSNVFSQTIRPVWQHSARVLVPGGRLLSGFMNPDFFLFDHYDIEAGGALEVRFPIPNADIDLLDQAELAKRKTEGVALEFSHSLDDQIAGQIDAGFLIAGFYEDKWDDTATPLNAFMPTSMATLAVKTQI